MEFYDDLVESLDPHPTNAQILFEIDDNQMALKRAQDILEALGVKTLQWRIIKKGDKDWALFLISWNDMREVTFKLSEAGFTRILGINPRPIKTT